MLLGALSAAVAAILLALGILRRSHLDLGADYARVDAARADPISRLGSSGFVKKLTGIEGDSASGRDFARLAGRCVGAAVAIVVVAFVFKLPALSLLALPLLRAPSIARSRAARDRVKEVDKEIPQLLDLLAAASSAGLAAPLALRRCVEPLRGPLADEIRATLRALDLGGRWSEEMRALADRMNLQDLTRAATLLTRTETLGSSLAAGVSDLADQVRSERRARRTERARAAPVKMLFPLVFLVLPAFLLLTVVPVFVTTLRSI